MKFFISNVKICCYSSWKFTSFATYFVQSHSYIIYRIAYVYKRENHYHVTEQRYFSNKSVYE